MLVKFEESGAKIGLFGHRNMYWWKLLPGGWDLKTTFSFGAARKAGKMEIL